MLSKYGILYDKYLQEYNPVKYQNLIMDGTINEYLEIKDKELNDEFDRVLEILKVKCIGPKSDSFLENVRYNNFIYDMANKIVMKSIMK